jgi:mannose-1-phosphate guanylyltransferase/phosphomannomutase
MEVTSHGDVTLAVGAEGGFIWPDFLPAFDACATLVKVLDLLAGIPEPLSTIRAELPPAHVVHEIVPTPWERKGAIMRELAERSPDPVLIDGVKVRHGDGWALVVPDPEDASCHVWAEGETERDARRLVEEYAIRVRQLARG